MRGLSGPMPMGAARLFMLTLAGLLALGSTRGAVSQVPPSPATGAASAAERRSGLLDMSPTTQALQRDDTLNPAMLWVVEGAARWAEPAPGGSCASCHGEAKQSMRGVATRYPALQASSAQPISLAQRIRACRRDKQGLSASAREGDIVLALHTFVAHQSRGMPIAPPQEPGLRALDREGEGLWHQRLGQLELSCAQCHDQLAGKRLAGSTIPQGHPTGYPLYRLEWQAVGTLQRRLRNCVVGVRAEPWPAEAREWLALERYLMRRASGMLLETPGVRP